MKLCTILIKDAPRLLCSTEDATELIDLVVGLKFQISFFKIFSHTAGHHLIIIYYDVTILIGLVYVNTDILLASTKQ